MGPRRTMSVHTVLLDACIILASPSGIHYSAASTCVYNVDLPRAHLHVIWPGNSVRAASRPLSVLNLVHIICHICLASRNQTDPRTNMVKATKQTKKFVSSGKLKQTIEKRRKYQQVQKKVAGRELRKAAKEKHGKGKHADEDSDEEDEEDEDLIVESDEDVGSKKNKGKGYVRFEARWRMSVLSWHPTLIARPSTMTWSLKT